VAAFLLKEAPPDTNDSGAVLALASLAALNCTMLGGDEKFLEGMAMTMQGHRKYGYDYAAFGKLVWEICQQLGAEASSHRRAEHPTPDAAGLWTVGQLAQRTGIDKRTLRAVVAGARGLAREPRGLAQEPRRELITAVQRMATEKGMSPEDDRLRRLAGWAEAGQNADWGASKNKHRRQSGAAVLISPKEWQSDGGLAPKDQLAKLIGNVLDFREEAVAEARDDLNQLLYGKGRRRGDEEPNCCAAGPSSRSVSQTTRAIQRLTPEGARCTFTRQDR